MTRKRGRTTLPGETGFALIEVVISALIIVIVGGAVLKLISVSTRSAAQQRARTQEYAAAQEDQARLRSMRISSLNHLKEVRPVTLNGTEFEVESTGTFVNNTSGTSSCTANESSADYVRIASTVRQKSGKGTPVSLQSIVSPSNGSLDPTHGTLVIAATKDGVVGVSKLEIQGSGASSFSGETDSNGCAIFADLPAGTYTVKASGTGLVEALSNSTAERQVQISGNQTQRLSLLFNQPGTLKAPFYYQLGATKFTVVPEDVVAYNAETGVSAKAYEPTTEEVGSTKYTVVSPLFPFKAAYTVYAGTCEANKPTSSGAMANGVVPVNGPVTTTEIRMPVLEITVTSNGSTKVQGARVTLSDDNCTAGDYVYTTESNGRQSKTTTGPMTPAVPWGTYDICASAFFSSANHRIFANNVPVETIAATVTKSLNLTGTGSESGSSKVCP